MTAAHLATAVPVDAATLLMEARRRTEPALSAAISELHPAIGRVASYHMGWTEVDGTPCSGGGGKAIRPALCLLGARLGGADYSGAVAGAAAVELAHNFSILHDDVMDEDRLRRHRPTAWCVFGTGLAVLAGDALLSQASRVLSCSGSPFALAAMRSLNGAVAELILGQAEDLSFESDESVGIDEYLRMSRHKTGALLACSLSIGALLTAAPRDVVDRLESAGGHLGLAFQAVDDLLGIWGSEELTGKPVFSDLRRRKKTLPIVHALRTDSAAGSELRWMFGSSEWDESRCRRAAELIEAAGGRDRANREADRHIELALEAIDSLPSVTPQCKAEAASLFNFIAARKA